MAIAGYLTKTAITTTSSAPSAGDVLGSNKSSAFNRSRAELATDYQGVAYTALITGKAGVECPVEVDYDPANTAQGRIETAYDAGTSIWVHVLFDGTTGKKVECKVTALSIGSSQDGIVTMSATIKSCGAVASSTLS